MFISEISPVSVSGPLGVISEFNITLGAFLSFIVGYIYIPLSGTPEEAVSGSWRVVFGFPLLIIFVHLILIGCIFTTDSPKFYATNKQKDKIKEFEQKIYIDPLEGEDSEELIEEPQEPSIVASKIDLSIFSGLNFKAFIVAAILSPFI